MISQHAVVVVVVSNLCVCVCSKISYSEDLARCRQRLTCKQKEFSDAESSLSEDSRSSAGNTINIRFIYLLEIVCGTCWEKLGSTFISVVVFGKFFVENIVRI